MAARIEFDYLRVRFGFQTRNPKRRPEWLQVRLVEGPFRHFQADWNLRPLGQLGCRIDFELSYQVSDGVLDRLAARAVDVVARSMVDAFARRAEQTLAPAPSLPAPPVPPVLAAPLVPSVLPPLPSAGATAPPDATASSTSTPPSS